MHAYSVAECTLASLQLAAPHQLLRGPAEGPLLTAAAASPPRTHQIVLLAALNIDEPHTKGNPGNRVYDKLRASPMSGRSQRYLYLKNGRLLANKPYL